MKKDELKTLRRIFDASKSESLQVAENFGRTKDFISAAQHQKDANAFESAIRLIDAMIEDRKPKKGRKN